MNFLQWAIPSGGIGAAIAWIANRKVKQAEGAKQIHDTFKAMYEDVSQELLKTQKKVDESNRENARAIEELNRENAEAIGKLNKDLARNRYALNKLTRAIEAIQLCPHRGSCPVSNELRNSEEADEDGATDAARGGKKRQQRKPKPDGKQPPRGDAADVETTGEERHCPARDIAD